MAFFPRLTAGDFTPLFRLLDDYDHHRASGSHGTNICSIRSFTPKFDVREVKDSYQLDGELPGINQRDIEIEFTDEHTLVIKGHAKREYTATNEDTTNDDAASTKSSHQATVEDEDTPASSTPAETPTTETNEVVKQTPSSKAVGKKPGYKYWVSERSVGQFQRTFSFPARVNQDAVEASLKDGILHIVVPKASAPTTKRVKIN
ncbi:30 kDa heat shock protein [Uncinocarpus reesii 1704]|uniref:30 kDa heat shock protein n=1 Tax=Uncinocarpus reesii (strain UAMH 1704) TaxID=336963 RepID=C4JZE7_UNCRE|nr:30 kDa heat shock protein [Uncinocarpus reesii 1704]EEP82683.1 30 kDa heat shock protein [Uncinocarpus reesii 1704]